MSGPDLLIAGPLFRKNVGTPIIWILEPFPRLPSPDTHSRHRNFVEDPCCNAHYTIAAARHTKSFPLFPNHYFSVSGLLLCCKNGKKFLELLWDPLFVGPLFGRTCWTCLNPPLGYIFVLSRWFVCPSLSVCLSVCRITRKVADKFSWNVSEEGDTRPQTTGSGPKSQNSFSLFWTVWAFSGISRYVMGHVWNWGKSLQ